MVIVEEHCKCESRVEQESRKGGGDTTEDMKKQARKRADHRGRLDIGKAVKPVEKALNGLAKRTDKGRKGIARDQDIVFAFFSRCEQFQSMVFLQGFFPVRVNVGLVSI